MVAAVLLVCSAACLYLARLSWRGGRNLPRPDRDFTRAVSALAAMSAGVAAAAAYLILYP